MAACRWQVSEAQCSGEADDQVVDGSQRFRGVSHADLGVILAQGVIAAIEQSVFDAPMGSDDGEEASGAGLLGAKTGNPIDGFERFLAVRLASDMTLQLEDLLCSWPIEISFQFVTDGKCAALDAAVTRAQLCSCAKVGERGAESR